MSDMEMFYGKVSKSDRTDVPEMTDEDDYLEWEASQLAHSYHRVGGQLYEVWKEDGGINEYGGTLLVPPSPPTDYHFLCYWYNGGACEREVIEDAIQSFRENHGL